MLHAGEFILQAIGSKYEILAMTDVECVCYRFSKPEFFCEDRYNHIMKEVTPPLIFYPLTITPELQLFLESSRPICPRRRFAGKCFVSNGKNLLSFLEITTPTMSFSMLIHPLAQYTNSFHYFVLQNHAKVKTVEELAQLGRIYSSYFPAYIQFCFSSTGVRVDDGTEEGKRGL